MVPGHLWQQNYERNAFWLQEDQLADTTVKVLSAVNQENKDQLEAMASELCKEYIAQNDELANKNDMTALFRIGYGLYVVTSNDGKKTTD